MKNKEKIAEQLRTAWMKAEKTFDHEKTYLAVRERFPMPEAMCSEYREHKQRQKANEVLFAMVREELGITEAQEASYRATQAAIGLRYSVRISYAVQRKCQTELDAASAKVESAKQAVATARVDKMAGMCDKAVLDKALKGLAASERYLKELATKLEHIKEDRQRAEQEQKADLKKLSEENYLVHLFVEQQDWKQFSVKTDKEQREAAEEAERIAEGYRKMID